MKTAVEAEGGPFTLFGGEPLLLPLKDLEHLLAWGFERFGENSLQTNGAPIRDEHISLFRRYKVSVGISLDGPGELNAVRSARSGRAESTAKATARVESAIRRLCEADMPPGLIVTMHARNARGEALTTMNDWFRELHSMGVSFVILHILESETDEVRKTLGLTTEENMAALLNFRELQRSLPKLRFSLFDELRGLLLGDDENASCVWNACDPYTTRAVRGVEGMGQRSNCGRVNKEGIDFEKTDQPGFERYIMLQDTDQASGGCAGCRFFLMCKGYCPGSSIGGDWRNRTEHCELWKGLFAHFEAELVGEGETPLSLRPDRPALEAAMVGHWKAGRNPSLASLERPS
jgi:uncharacterized protein